MEWRVTNKDAKRTASDRPSRPDADNSAGDRPSRPDAALVIIRSATMKIASVQTFLTWGEPRNWVFVKLTTDTGLYGWGEATLEGHEETIRASVEEMGRW